MRNACSVLMVGLAMFSLADCESTGRKCWTQGDLRGEFAGRYKCHLNNQKNKVEQDFMDVKIGVKKTLGILIDQIKPGFSLQ